jgi:O-antigen/teichoic acid export membrane protein
MSESGTPVPKQPPAGEVFEEALEASEPFEGRFDLDGRSLRAHTARGVVINSAFQVGLAALGLLKRVAVAAFLTASEFGVWGLLLTTLITLAWLKQIGVGDKYVQQSERDQELAFQKAFTIELAYTLCFYAVVLVALPVYAAVYDQSEILVPGYVLSLALLGSALHTPIWIAYRQMRFVRQRTLEAIDPVVSVVLTIALAAAGMDYWSLVIGTVAGSACGAIAAIATCPYPIRLRWDRETVRDYFGFSWPLFVTGASSMAVVQAAVIVGNFAVGLAGVGALALAASFSLFVDRVDQVIRMTIYPAVVAVRDQTEVLFEAFIKSNRLALMWGMPFGVALALFGPDLVEFVLGSEWEVRGVAGLLQAFGLILAFRQVAFNWSVFMSARGNTRPMAVNGVLAMVTFFAVTVPLMYEIGLDGYALGMAIVLLVELCVRVFYLRRLFGGFRFGAHLARAIAPSIPAVAVILGFRAISGLDRTAGLAVAELVLYIAVTVVATMVFERRLLAEMVGYARGSSPKPAPAT